MCFWFIPKTASTASSSTSALVAVVHSSPIPTVQPSNYVAATYYPTYKSICRNYSWEHRFIGKRVIRNRVTPEEQGVSKISAHPRQSQGGSYLGNALLEGHYIMQSTQKTHFLIFHMIPDGYQQGKRSKNRQPFQKSKCQPLLPRKNSTWLRAHWKLSSSALQGIWGMVLWCTLVGILVFETPCLFFFFFCSYTWWIPAGYHGKKKEIDVYYYVLWSPWRRPLSELG